MWGGIPWWFGWIQLWVFTYFSFHKGMHFFKTPPTNLLVLQYRLKVNWICRLLYLRTRIWFIRSLDATGAHDIQKTLKLCISGPWQSRKGQGKSCPGNISTDVAQHDLRWKSVVPAARPTGQIWQIGMRIRAVHTWSKKICIKCGDFLAGRLRVAAYEISPYSGEYHKICRTGEQCRCPRLRVLNSQCLSSIYLYSLLQSGTSDLLQRTEFSNATGSRGFA